MDFVTDHLTRYHQWEAVEIHLVQQAWRPPDCELRNRESARRRWQTLGGRSDAEAEGANRHLVWS